MAEGHTCLMVLEFEHIKSEFMDVKSMAKEQGRDMLLMRDSHVETKLYIQQIQASQAAMAQETKDSQKEMKENQKEMMKGIQELRDEPGKSHKAKDMVIWTLIASWILSNAFGLIKTFAPKLIGQ